MNASVFYDSSFWSMFFPVRKNLMIGLGLVNCIHKEELKAILSHEFGHFSQRTMKVGSYVYQVNQVIFNMLYDNESFDKIAERWANISWYIGLFVVAAIHIVRGIQWILQKLYGFVNKNYLSLSREMEFHADEIAANVTGYKPLANSLLRMNLTDHALNTVLSYYDQRISRNISSTNFYKEQSFVVDVIAKNEDLPLKGGLPEITLEYMGKFNKSRLVVKNQWASHPSTRDRIARLEASNIIKNEHDNSPANGLFSNIESRQEQLTRKLLDMAVYTETPKVNSLESFKEDFKKEYSNNSFSRIYNGYYDNKNPIPVDLKDRTPKRKLTLDELFSEQEVSLVYAAIALENDIEVIKQISDKTLNIKSFDYDGIKYSRKKCDALLSRLQAEFEQTKAEIKANDQAIFQYFNAMEHSDSDNGLLRHYTALYEFDDSYEDKMGVANELYSKLEFVSETTATDKIISNFKAIKPLESTLKEKIEGLLANPDYDSELTAEMKERLHHYVSNDLTYFGLVKYDDENLQTLFYALNDYTYLVSRGYFICKKELLDYQVSLLN